MALDQRDPGELAGVEIVDGEVDAGLSQVFSVTDAPKVPGAAA